MAKQPQQPAAPRPVDAIDVTVSVTEFIGSTAALAVKMGRYAMPVAEFMAGFIPGLRPALQVLQVATPIIAKIAEGAPTAAKLIEKGRPVIEAIQDAGPDMMVEFRKLIALAINADPKREEQHMEAADVSDREVVKFAGPVLLGRAWTLEEEHEHFDRMTIGAM